MIIDFIKRVLVPHMRKYNLKKLYFMIDCAKCHEKQTVRDYCDKKGIVVKFVPKRLTNLLQPVHQKFREICLHLMAQTTFNLMIVMIVIQVFIF